MKTLIATCLLLTALTVNAEFTNNLQYGQKSEDVTKLQDFLYEQRLFLTSSTGYFGRITENAVKKYQILNGIVPTGLVATTTRTSLNIDLIVKDTIKVRDTIIPPCHVVSTSTIN